LAEPDITGLILAGGAGRRAGGVDKGLLEWHGTPLAERVAACLRPHVGRLTISCNRNRAFYARLADEIVFDRRGGYQGPLAGIEAVLPLLRSEYLVVVPCDTPLLPPDLVPRLVAPLLQDATAGLCYAHDGDRDQYLCVALRRDTLLSLGDFLGTGQRAVRTWYAQFNFRVVDFSEQAGCFVNCNEGG